MTVDLHQLMLDLSEPDQGVMETLARSEDDLMLLGAGGKIGHGLALMAKRAFDATRRSQRVLAVSQFSDENVRNAMERDGITTISCDLMDSAALAKLPDVGDLVYMAGQKFGTEGAASVTWMRNTVLPALVAQRWPNSRFVVYSSGNVYPFTTPRSDGPAEDHALGPIGEYAQSVLGRERVFEFFSRTNGTKIVTLRLNYAVEPRYGVLVDLGTKILAGEPIDLTTGHVNIVWQGDANRVTLRSLDLASSPPTILNLAGPRHLGVRDLACQLGRALKKEPVFTGTEAA
ncbi:MAG: NAD-dependent epimerase/dehydratase family protein, partial [Dehalococcoidia bacterium]|nr:NAD-dependent epimerase/dehydratase family protein [Dehalococcoidia bacterium]